MSHNRPEHWRPEHWRPEHWTCHAGPALWFKVWTPPHWELAETNGVLNFAAPDRGGLLTIRTVWSNAATVPTPVDLIDLARLFPRRRKVRNLNPLAISAPSLALEGEMQLSEGQRWWQRLLRRGEWRRWRLWTVQQGPVSLVAMYLQTDRPDPEAETLAAMILNTLEFADQPADPPARFAERVLQLARKKFPLLECESVAEFQLRIGESNVNLFNFYRTYVAAPDQFESIILPVLSTVVQVQGWGKEVMEPELETVRERVMPMLYPESAWLERFPNFVGTVWIAGLVVLYVVDESQAYWYIRDELLQKWGMSPETLHELALANLDRYFEDAPMEFTLAGEPDGPQLLLPVRPDAYNTARFLSSRFQQKARELLGQQFAVGVPSRDFFVAVSLNSEQAVAQVCQKVREDFQQMDHPLSDHMLLVTTDGVSEYQPD